MKVKDLIRILSSLDPEAEVFLGDDTDPYKDRMAWRCEGLGYCGTEHDKVVLSHGRNQDSCEYLAEV
jgi:hypothetical protein